MPLCLHEASALKLIKMGHRPAVQGATFNQALEVLLKRGLAAVEMGELTVTPAGDAELAEYPAFSMVPASNFPSDRYRSVPFTPTRMSDHIEAMTKLSREVAEGPSLRDFHEAGTVK